MFNIHVIPQQLFVKVGRGLDDLLRISIGFGFHGSTDVLGRMLHLSLEPGSCTCVGVGKFRRFSSSA